MEFSRDCAHRTLTFDAIRACIHSSHTDELGRSEAGQRQYVEAMELVKAKYANVSEYILCKKFGFAEISRKGDNKLQALRPESSNSGEGQLVWSLNDFPETVWQSVEIFK